jgi:sulfatase maturation enzyme AslB (radical SAM superfamily)
MTKQVLCTAPLTAALIDTNKGVRPCCVYGEEYIGNIKEERLINIINGAEWKKIKEQMYANEWPVPCLSCKEREDVTGWSVRTLFSDGSFDVDGWEQEKLTYLEFNGSNICNLACLHCTPGFSSRWVIDNKKAKAIFDTYDQEIKDKIHYFDAVSFYTDDKRGRSTKMHLPNPELVLENLKDLDLSNLRTINFKGGEPLLNSETLAILNHLDELSILGNVSIILSSNGTYVNQEIIDVFKKCKKITFNLSLDGIDELFNYIRYGDAKFIDIESVIAKLNVLTNISVQFQVSIMNYNIFNLEEIREWGVKMSEKYSVVHNVTGFSNCVQYPKYLSLQTLSDDTRKELIAYYNNLRYSTHYETVIKALEAEYIGDDIHDDWVHYTNLMQTVRGNNILSIVPQLAKELKFNKKANNG